MHFFVEETSSEEIGIMKGQMEIAEAYMQSFNYQQACSIYEAHKQKVKTIFG